MSYCLNPVCPNPTAPLNHSANHCTSCGFALLLGDRFRALKPIGQGGFGRTFLAVDEATPTKPRCVIKQSMPDQLTHREQAAALFHQEALRLAELGAHPQIPALITHCEQDNYQYLVQEFIDGQTLAQTLRDRGPFAVTDIERILHSLLPVLEFIHSREVIHRDIKPDNIIRRPDGQLALVDFGAAKHATGTALLKTGTSIGSAEFIAPEQARGKATYASDLYSLGVTCVHLLTQMSPFDLIDGDNQWVWQDWLQGKISPELRHCLNRMIASAPNQRFQSAQEVQEFLAKPRLPDTKPSSPLPATSALVAPPVSTPRSRPLRKPLTFTAIFAFSVGAIAAAVTLPRFAAEANRAKESEAKVYIGTLGRAQQAYFLEKNQFSPELDALGMGIPFENKNYSYQIAHLQNQTDPRTTGMQRPLIVQHVAQPKKGDLRSYISIVWTTPIVPELGTLPTEITTMSIRCESQQPTVQLPPPPLLTPTRKVRPGNARYQAQCPAGYANLDR